MPVNRVVIEVKGGCVQAVYATKPAEITIKLVDWDNIEQGDPKPTKATTAIMTENDLVF